MQNSIEPKDNVKGYRFLYFSKNVAKTLKSKYGQKLLDSTKKSETDAAKTDSKKAIQKPADATGHQGGNNISDRIKTSACKDQIKSKAPTQTKETLKPVEIPKEMYTPSKSTFLMNFDYLNYRYLEKEWNTRRS